MSPASVVSAARPARARGSPASWNTSRAGCRPPATPTEPSLQKRPPSHIVELKLRTGAELQDLCGPMVFVFWPPSCEVR